MEEKHCIVQFKYNCVINDEEKPRVVGNIKELGNWEVSKSEPLVRDCFNPSLWKTKENISILQNSTVEYKYIIFKNNKLDRWENLPNNMNRVLHTGNNIRIVIADRQDDPNSSIEKSDSIHIRKESNSDNEEFGREEFEFDQNLGREGDYNAKQRLEEPEEINDDFKSLNYESNDEADDTFQNKNVPEKQREINDSDDILMCSFYLPFNIIKDNKGEITLELTNEPLYHTLFRLIENKKNVKWFGSIKNYSSLSDIEIKEISSRLKEKNMYIINADKETFNTNIILFKEILEPLFHYITLRSSIIEDFSNFEAYWEAYKKMNEKLCDALLPHLNQNSLIYLHDYHFFLTPNYLYSRCSNLNQKLFHHISIGLFMHSPFPSHEIFKRIPFREEILKSMINCSVIGFHTFDFSRNFLISAKRLLSINYESTINGDLAVNFYDRAAIVRVKNATPEIDLVKEDFNSQEFKKFYNEIKEKCKDKFIFVSMDQMKFLSGIKNKLEGYKKFLSDIKGVAKKNIYLQYIRCSSDDLDKDGNLILDVSQREMLDKIDKLVEQIQKEFGKDTIELIKKKVTYTERLAVFAGANCFIRSSKQESFSLGIYEFLILKHLLKEEDEVSYMISELSGVNTSLAGTIKINPFDYKSIYNGFLQASQPVYIKEKDNTTKEKDFTHVMKSSLKEWFYSFLKDIKNTKLTNENTFYFGVGKGLNFRLMKIKSDLKKFNLTTILPEYEKSNKRLLFINYEGTLPSANEKEEHFKLKGIKPSEETLSLLEELTLDKHNTVILVSGREAKLVSEWFGNIKGLYLAAEHGFIYTCNELNHKNKWTKILKNFNNDWISNCVEILEPYTERCEGSFIEIKEASVFWQYGDCDHELGKEFATVIINELEFAVKKINLKVINGKGYVGVIAVNKGNLVSFILKELLAQHYKPDFIFCIGDDLTDEKMFHYLKDKKEEILKQAKNAKIFTVTVGKKPSAADYFVDNQQEVLDIMKQFAKVSNSKPSSLSTKNIKFYSKHSKNLFE